MEQLIKGSTAYKIFCREAEAGRLAHAYMLSFNDPANLRRAPRCSRCASSALPRPTGRAGR